MRIILSITKKACKVLLLLSILILGLLPLMSVLLNRPAPVSVVRSFSMEPVCTRGDLVVVWPTGGSYDYTFGQIVVFQSVEHGISDWTMHRIVGGDAETGFITRGDANERTDQADRYPPIQPEWIGGVAPSLGNYPLKVPFLGYALLFFIENMKNPFLFSVLLFLLALFILIRPKQV